MADEGTLATTAQVLLSIGANASAAQILETNTNIWIKYAESDMEKMTGGKGLVANYGDIGSTYKQWIAIVAANRAAWYAINQNQDQWGLATAQSKLNILDTTWQEFKKDVQPKDQDVIDNMGL